MGKISSTQRLLVLLRRAAQEQTRLGADANVGQLLAAIVGCPKDDVPAQHEAYIRLLALCDAAADEITAYYYDSSLAEDDSAHVIQQAKKPLEEIRGSFLSNSLHSKGRILTQFNLGPLEVLALTVTRHSPEVVLQKSDIDEARKALTQGLKIITDSGLDPRFKSAFSKLVDRALAALNQYDVFGPDSVAEAVGILLAHGVAIQQQSSPEPGSRMATALKIIGSLLGIVYRGFQIHHALGSSDDITKYLPGGPQ